GEGSHESMAAGIDALERVDPDNPNVAIHRAADLHGPSAPQAVELLGKVLTREDLTPALRSHALRTRGRSFSEMGNDSAAFREMELAIRLRSEERRVGKECRSRELA